jgi:Fic family protein
MAELVTATRTALESRALHPLLVIAAFVVHFLAIHPFQDGNARLSRVLTTLLLLCAGYLYVPYSSLERVVEENKDGYYRALRSSQRHIRTDREDLGDWIRFFLTILKQQKDVLLRKTELEKRLGTLPADAERIVSLARERGHLSIAEVVELLGINRNTAKVHLRNLVDEGWLTRQGVGRATRYTVGR